MWHASGGGKEAHRLYVLIADKAICGVGMAHGWGGK